MLFRSVMAWLCRRVNNHMGAYFFDQGLHPGPVANVQFMVDECRQTLLQPLLIPAGVALRPEKHRALIIIHAMYFPAKFARKIHADFGTNQAGRAGDEEGFHKAKAKMLTF